MSSSQFFFIIRFRLALFQRIFYFSPQISMSVRRTLVHVTKTQLAPTWMGPTPVLANKDLLGMEQFARVCSSIFNT